jgi:hypothetical protein
VQGCEPLIFVHSNDVMDWKANGVQIRFQECVTSYGRSCGLSIYGGVVSFWMSEEHICMLWKQRNILGFNVTDDGRRGIVHRDDNTHFKFPPHCSNRCRCNSQSANDQSNSN